MCLVGGVQSTWVLLGEANNTLRETGDSFHSFSAFDLGILEWAKYIKVVDTTNPVPHSSGADGFDLNAVEALQDCVQEETAWGEGDPIRPDKNWAMYFTYIIEEIFIETVTVYPSNDPSDPKTFGVYCSSANLETGKKYRLDVSGTYRFADWGVAGIADAKYSLRSSTQNSPWTSGDDLPTPWKNYLELWVNGNSQAWGSYNLAHTYSMVYDGDGNPVYFSIIDSHYTDNSGSLTVKIYWVP